MSDDIVIEIGKYYRIIYNDLGHKPVEKRGIVTCKEDTLFKLDSNPKEALNTRQIIRAVEMR